MSQNLFFPIYQQLERELVELSYYITFNRRQLNVYSTKIADMLLRTVSEIENISKELCKKENIKFYDNKRHIRKIVYFNDYYTRLEEKYGLSNKLVDFTLDNCTTNIFDIKLSPFKKDISIKIGGKERKSWGWYNAYNKIKHDRVKNFSKANLGNLIYSLSALFLLNIYYMDNVFIEVGTYNHAKIIDQIEGFSKVFRLDYTLDTTNSEISKNDFEKYSFFNPVSYFEIGRHYATYIIYKDILFKTPSDEVADKMQLLDSKMLVYDKDGQTLKKVYDNYDFEDHYTKCKLVAKLNKND
ncbi:hypothetical protein [Lacrimispora brassicae]